MIKNNNKNKYLKDVWILFPLHGNREKEYVSFLKKQIANLEIDENENTYLILSEKFGSPREIISSFYEEVDPEYILMKMNSRNILKKTLISLNIMLLIVVLWLMTLIYMSYLETKQGIIKCEEVIIEEH